MTQLTETAVEKVVQIEVVKIFPNKHAIRKADDEELDEMAASMLRKGVILPLIVREAANDRYEIAAGERRWRAAVKAGLVTVPCIVRVMTGLQLIITALMENMLRKDLDFIGEANGYKALDELAGTNGSPNEICRLIGRNSSHSANRVRILLRLLEMPEEIQELADKLGLKKLEILQRIDDVGAQISLAQKACKGKGWSIKRLTSQAQRYFQGGIGVPVARQMNDEQMVGYLSNKLLGMILDLDKYIRQFRSNASLQEKAKELEAENLSQNIWELLVRAEVLSLWAYFPHKGDKADDRADEVMVSSINAALIVMSQRLRSLVEDAQNDTSLKETIKTDGSLGENITELMVQMETLAGLVVSP